MVGLSKEVAMKIGARNQIVGTVSDIKRDGVMCEVKLDVPASAMASVMTAESADELQLQKGDKVRVIVKAIHVLLIKE
jgi:molybdate transport system regulatory protein